MRTFMLVHVTAGGLGLLSGYLALYAAKGGTLHRRIGMVFVSVMLTLAITGLLISAFQGVAPAINIPTALLTFYLVITGLTTVRSSAVRSRSIDIASLVLGASVTLICFAVGVAAIAGGGRDAGLAYPLFLFGAIALSATVGDRRLIRAGEIRGTSRLARHLWRMCVGLFIASIAFYLGPNRLPEALRSPFLRGAGLLLPLVVMLYWLWRLRVRKTFRGIVRVSAPHATTAEAVR